MLFLFPETVVTRLAEDFKGCTIHNEWLIRSFDLSTVWITADDLFPSLAIRP
jgi:hypothetical protein